MILCFYFILFLKSSRPSLPLKKEFFLPLRLSCKESSTFLTKPLFNGLYDPFGSPSRGQKPQEREDVTALSAVFAPPVPPQREGPYPIPKP